MSHTIAVYFQAIGADLTFLANAPCDIREEEEGYCDFPDGLVELTDTVIDRLLKAEALCWVLHGSKNYPENALAETTGVIADLIHEALQAHREQWQHIQRLTRRKG